MVLSTAQERLREERFHSLFDEALCRVAPRQSEKTAESTKEINLPVCYLLRPLAPEATGAKPSP